MDLMERERVIRKKEEETKVKAMLRGIPNWIFGIGQSKTAPPLAAQEDPLLEQLWIEAVERRTNFLVDDVITGQHYPSAAKPAPIDGKGHWFDHR